MSKQNGGIEEYRKKLAIDRDDLSTCLADQVEFFYSVANNHVQAIANRDKLKLEIEELHAALDQSIRETAAENEEKVTEAGIQQRIKDKTEMRKLKSQHLDTSTKAEEWGALKEAFHQRSYMLRELVALLLKQMSIEQDVMLTEKEANNLKSKQGDAAIAYVRKARAADKNQRKRFSTRD